MISCVQYAKVGKLTFFKSADRKSANYWAHSAFANPQTLELIPLSQILKFFLYMPLCKSKIRKFLWLICKLQIRTFLQNTAHFYLKTVLKFVFIQEFVLCTNFNWSFICYVRRKGMFLRNCESFMSTNHKKDWTRKWQIHKGSHLLKVRNSK